MAALAGWGLINHHPPGPRPGSRRACVSRRRILEKRLDNSNNIII